MRKAVFVKFVESLKEDDLREELLRLYEGLEEVRGHYRMELGSRKDRDKYYEKAKDNIRDKFKTKSYRKPRRPRIQKLNAFVKELEKSAVFPHELIDIYLHIVETAVTFSYEYRFASGPIFNTILKYYEKALEQIRLCRMTDDYQSRCQSILGETRAMTSIGRAMREAFDVVYPKD